MCKRYAILHSALCDNYKRCPSMLRCEELAKRQGRETAIYLDDRGKIRIKKENCIGCSECLKRCGLFRIVSGVWEEHEWQEEFAKDPRSHLETYVERFGCDIIDKVYLLNTIDDVYKYINDTQGRIKILEFVVEQNAYCPMQGIEVNAIISQISSIAEYKKYVVPSDDGQNIDAVRNFFEKHKQTHDLYTFPFPSVVVIKDGIVAAPVLIQRILDETTRKEKESLLILQFQQRIEGFSANE